MGAMSEWDEFIEKRANGFKVPQGHGRCGRCGFHLPTMHGHREGCPYDDQEGAGR